MYKIIVLVSLAFFLPVGILIAQASSTSVANKQKKEQLEQQMKKLRKEIADMEKQIDETTSKKKENLEQVEMLKEQIKKRESLIGNYSNQIQDLQGNIIETKKDIDAESEQIDKMKKDYAQMLRKTYSSLALQNEYLFLISASSFNDAFERYNYIKRMSDYRRRQAVALDLSIHELEGKKMTLEQSKKKKQSLLESQSEQKEKLEGEKEETDKMISQLSEKEKKMHRYVDEKNKAAQALNNKIQKIIEDEIKQARKKAEDAAKKKALAEGKPQPKPATTTNSKGHTETVIMMSPKDQELSKDFAGNKGKLPWPVAKGTIVGQFGKHEHSTLKGVFVENNGIDIKAADGANARAIFNGSVVSVFTLPTTQTCIIVKHGEYFSVYSNIASAAVKSNDNVITKQNLGTLGTDKSDSQTKVHLEIWKGKDKLNPAEWISGN
jgi:septal ring factor EnvC (AmiA/AmiB activator)